MKKKTFIIIAIILCLIITVLVILLVTKDKPQITDNRSDELKKAEATFDLRLNSTKDEYYIYGLKNSANTTGSSIVIPDSIDDIPVTKIIEQEKSFSGYNKIKSIKLGKNINYIGKLITSDVDALYGDDIFLLANALENIEVDDDNLTFSSENGILYNKDKTILIKYPVNRINTTNEANDQFVIPDSVVTIYAKAFYYNKHLNIITFGKKVENVNNMAFGYLASLVNITFNEHLKNIKNNAFEHCTSLDSINLPSSLETLGGRVFYGCQNLVNVYFNSDVKSILANCFSGCIKLSNIYIAEPYVDNLKTLFLNLNEEKIANLVKVNK